ncbi:MAG: MATE family efflux transporter [Lachnospiraceae bacterium]|nr:MATE family efflux transporter [Lachnospiraceae bacterium]
MTKDHLADLRKGADFDLRRQLLLIIQLSIPAILSQITTVAMEYIDASMVGHLGRNASASVGIVSSSTWLAGGIAACLGAGFYVQVAHRIGAEDYKSARDLVKHGLLTELIFSSLIGLAACAVSFRLPYILGGAPEICRDASRYFFIFSCGLPLMGMVYTAGGMLQCSGNMRIPSAINILECIFDVIFNFFFIYGDETVQIAGLRLQMHGAGYGVMGAALGTFCAEGLAALLMLYFLLVRSDKLAITGRRSSAGENLFNDQIHENDHQESFLIRYHKELKTALTIAIPIGIENLLSSGAQIVSTKIVSPLGTAAIAANSFSVTAEGLCYMPGYGISSAATTITGQCYGAGRLKLTRRLSWLAIFTGMAVMTVTGLLMYIFAPEMIGILSPDNEIRAMGSHVLQIEAFAEPMFAASIVCSGVMRGYGDTVSSSIINLFCMWFLRLPLAAFMAPRMGLAGVWIAMCAELNICGILFMIRLHTGKRYKHPGADT